MRTVAIGLTFPTSASSGLSPSISITSAVRRDGLVEAGDYEHAAPDPLANAAPGILAHMNADHVDAMILLASAHAEIEANEATMTSVTVWASRSN